MHRWTFSIFSLLFTARLCNCDLDAVKWKEWDKHGYEAIVQLHKHLDDDKSGSIDRHETNEFLQEELHVKDKDPLARRQQAFHHNNDEFITVDDLWISWLGSDERKWTTEETIRWLVNCVELPQYADVFTRHSVNGTHLPRLAVQNSTYSYMQAILNINSAQHRQKLHVKAMDVVLFGYRGAKSSYAKDILLIALLIAAVAAYWFAMYQRKASLKQAHALTSQLGKLKDMEQDFMELQNKLEEERCRQESCKTSIADEELESREELESLRYQLQEAERQRSYRSPLLQSLLRKTFEMELSRINLQKIESLKEMNEARELVEKLRKKQSSLLSQIRSVHSGETELIDERIIRIREKMELTARSMEECEQRWLEIEYLMGFKIVNSPSNGEGVRTGVGATLSSVPGYSRSHVFASGPMDVENDAYMPLSDATDPHAPFPEPASRAACIHHHHHPRQASGAAAVAHRLLKAPLNATGSVSAFATNASTSVPGDGQFYRPKFKIGGSDIVRSASTSDLVDNGDALSSSEGVVSSNEPSHSNPGSISGHARHRVQVPLANVDKKQSQMSMDASIYASSAEHAATKPKKKLISLFGGKKTE